MTEIQEQTDDKPITATPEDEARLAEMAMEEVAAALASKEPLWLDENWEAHCPVPGYEGAIRYPPVMGLDRYKVWRKMTEESSDDDREMVLAFVYVGDSQRTEAFFFSMLYFKLAQEMGAIAIKNRAGKPVNLAKLDDLPIALVAWLALTAKYWLENQLTFRVDSR